MASAKLTTQKPLERKFMDLSTILINKDVHKIGRTLDNDTNIPYIGISRQHCIFKYKNDGIWYVQDNSSFGMRINNVEIPKGVDVRLQDGDVFNLDSGENFLYKFNMVETAPTPLPKLSNRLDKNKKVKKLDEKQMEEENKEQLEKGNMKQHIIEESLTCTICCEMIINTMVLNCSHVFCDYCIKLWQKKSTICPICRSTIKQCKPLLMSDRMISEIVQLWDERKKNNRSTIIKEREEKLKVSASGRPLRKRRRYI